MNLAALFRQRPAAPVPVAAAHPVAPVPVVTGAAPAPKTGSRLRKSAAAALLCTTTVGGFEGVRTTAYPDPATSREPWTVCYGETEGVKRGDTYTLQQCREMLTKSLEKYALRLEGCISRPMPDTTYAAFLSLSYNIGSGGFCKSSVAREWNAGHSRAACDNLLKFNKAAGITFPGLTRRRTQERALCLQGANL